MAEFTKLNLKDDVENASERFGLAPQMEARFARRAMGLEGGGFSYQKLAPDFRAPLAHRHKTQEEVYVILAGGGRIKIEDEVLELRQWDAVRLPPETVQALVRVAKFESRRQWQVMADAIEAYARGKV